VIRSLKIVALSASASASSKTARVAEFALTRFADSMYSTVNVHLRSIPLDAMLDYPARNERLMAVNEELASADGVIIATPIYKASYSGLLKLYLDKLPQFAFAGKGVLPLATGGSIAHVLALDYALRPVLQSMGARHIVQSHFILEGDIMAADATTPLREEVMPPLTEAIHHFTCSLLQTSGDKLLGHPRPQRPLVPALHAH
jgi:FMN reductase